jgi:hypothetical protein
LDVERLIAGATAVGTTFVATIVTDGTEMIGNLKEISGSILDADGDEIDWVRAATPDNFLVGTLLFVNVGRPGCGGTTIVRGDLLDRRQTVGNCTRTGHRFRDIQNHDIRMRADDQVRWFPNMQPSLLSHVAFLHHLVNHHCAIQVPQVEAKNCLHLLRF